MRARHLAVCVSLVACSGSPPGKPVTPTEPPPVVPPPVAAWTPPPDDDPVCKPSTPTPEEPPEEYDSEIRGRRAKAKNACTVADANLARLEKEVAVGAPAKAAASKAWDGKSKLPYTDLIARRFALTGPELTFLEQHRVVVPGRLEMPSYVHAYHEVFQSQLPVYVTADSIFHAVFASHDDIVASLESEHLMPLLAGALDAMHCALPAAVGAYPHDVARDVDLYLTVARSLGDAPASGKLGDATVASEAAAIVGKITAAAGVENLQLFGRSRAVDFTQYTPRGHYTRDEVLKRFFHMAMWASRLELNLVSRGSRSSVTEVDPKETPREALVALALVDLAGRAGVMPSIEKLDSAWRILAGAREDVSFTQLAALRTKAGITALTDATAFDALKKAIGGDFKRTTRIHVMPDGVKELPAIATLLGPRIVADAHAVMPIVHDSVPDRNTLRVADIAFTMGFDHARTYLAADLAKYPSLDGKLAAAKKIVAGASGTGDDLYSAWYGAIRALAHKPAGAAPSYLATRAGQDLRLNTIAAAYGQLKHNYALVAGQPYSSFGCEIPDGYVEPAVEAYDRLIEYTRRGATLAALFGAKSKGVAAYYERAGAVLKMLRGIAADELADRPLTAAQKSWLGMVAELTIDRDADITGHPPMYTGWYFDLYYERESGGMRDPSFIADYYTSKDGIAYAGAGRPRMAVFVVDAGGAPRAMVGPVASAYEVFGPLATRYSDETAKSAPRSEPWAASYALAVPATAPRLKVQWDPEDKKAVLITTDRAYPSITLRTLDHHRVPLQTKTVKLVEGLNVVPFTRTKDVNALYLEVGAWRDFALGGAYGDINAAWGDWPDGE